MLPSDTSNWTEENWSEMREWLKGLMEDNVVTVVFTKKDGTERVMRCTTNPELVPQVVHETNTSNPIDFPTVKKERKINMNTLVAYDLAKSDWRSFVVKSVKSVAFDLG